MKRFKGTNWKMRILSVALALALLVTMISLSDWSSIVNAAGAPSDVKISMNAAGAKVRVRGVLNDLPIPAEKRSGAAYEEWLKNWYNTEKGTPEHPFTIVELTPYYEMGSFGYLIDGCEPVDFDRLAGNQKMYSYQNLKDLFEIKPNTSDMYFFTDEMEGKQEFYVDNNGQKNINDTTWASYKAADNIKLMGYYEVVEEGQGAFRLTNTENDKGWWEILPADNASTNKKGTLNWHTVNDSLAEKWEAQGLTCFTKGENSLEHPYYSLSYLYANGGPNVVISMLNKLDLTRIGARYFTSRTTDAENPAVKIPSGNYFEYVSKDSFVRNTIGLDAAGAGNYSVWIKNITPVEFNENPQWADIADLVIVERYCQDTSMVDLYKLKDASGVYYNRLNRAPARSGNVDQNNSFYNGNYDNQDYSGYNGKPKDISWTVAEKILKRVASAKNYCGLVFDYTFRNGLASNNSVTFYNYDLVTNERLKDSNGNWDTVSGVPSYQFNIGKLWLACVSCKPNLVQRFFIDSGKIVGVDRGDNYNVGEFSADSNRSNYEKEYWSSYSFYFGSSVYGNLAMREVDSNTNYWEDYNGFLNSTQDVVYVQGHTYTFNGNQALFQTFLSGGVGARTDRFDDFNEYLHTNAKTRQIWERNHPGESYASVNSQNVETWAALRYILDLDRDGDTQVGDITVLDIEPSVALGAGSKPVWTFDETQVALLVPSIAADADITIVHEIMPSFVGRNEDLNSLYDLIYLGDDIGGLWTGAESHSSFLLRDNNTKNSHAFSEKWQGGLYSSEYKADIATKGEDRTNFIDDSMDGLIYFHVGDYFYITRNLDANFILGVDTGNLSRQPGNDLSKLKKMSLESYLAAGFPIVGADVIYNYDDGYIGKDCVLYDFLKGHQAIKASDGSIGKGVLSRRMVGEVDDRILARKNARLQILDSPVEYDSSNPASYLPRSSSGKTVLRFRVSVPQVSGYSYRIYLDQDRNGKFTLDSNPMKTEVVKAGQLTALNTEITTETSDDWVGFIQWRIEVYKTDSPDVRVAKEGCSAAMARAESEKNKILALQIGPNNGGEGTGTNLASRSGNGGTITSGWTKLYDQVKDFNIEVVKISWEQFESLFKDASGNSYNFHYDMGRGIDAEDDADGTNPDMTILDKIKTQADHPEYINSILGGHTLGEFNMLVIGFGDIYGKTDASNRYGCAEYLFYFAEEGHSILFTHDLTIHFNDITSSKWLNENKFGYTANTMLRDIMGMNRYGMVSKWLKEDRSVESNFNIDGSETLRKNLEKYNELKNISFDYNSSIYTHGYTYWCLLNKIGERQNWDRHNSRGQYKFSLINPEDVASNNPNGPYNYSSWNGGAMFEKNRETTVAVRLNKGQITQYPFTIPEVLRIANTHGQYYALNMEDPELSVWYTLEDPAAYDISGYSRKTDDTTLIYGVTPQEPSGNYYIYSKGNIFYSGVGHRDVTGEDEMKLFVNTLVAAYRPSFMKPQVEVTNATPTGTFEYTMRILEEFNYSKDGSGNIILDDNTIGTNTHTDVFFIPRDYGSSEFVKVKIAYDEDGGMFEGAVYEVTTNGAGVKTVSSTVAPKVTGTTDTWQLRSGTEYAIKYENAKVKKSSPDKFRHIIFTSTNDKVVGDPGRTDLYIKPQPLFALD